MIFREIEIKSAGGCYKLRVTVNFEEISLIDRTPTGFVRTPTVNREIDLRSRHVTYASDTVSCIKTTREFRSEINFFDGTFQVDYEL